MPFCGRISSGSPQTRVREAKARVEMGRRELEAKKQPAGRQVPARAKRENTSQALTRGELKASKQNSTKALRPFPPTPPPPIPAPFHPQNLCSEDSASVLFIAFDDFEEVVQRKTPPELLQFLNKCPMNNLFLFVFLCCCFFLPQQLKALGSQRR